MKIKYYPDPDILEIREIRVSDEKPKHGEECEENIAIHYSEKGDVVKIKILDASGWFYMI